ncbi:MAG: rhodanese-like domain-containing protein [Gallionella sp.]|jgi:rhodanese-related sulfurtransferase
MFTATRHDHASSEAQIQSHEILATVRKAAHRSELPHAGNVTPEQAWTLVSAGVAELIDVRTDNELLRTGHVPGAGHVEWLTGAGMSKNPRFISQLGSLVSKGNVVLFLCRSGKRSTAAAEAATGAGFRNAFNVLEGFEGDGNPKLGWLNRRLPSAQD